MYGADCKLLLDEERYRRVAAEAERRKVSVATVIREAIDRSLPSDLERRRAAIDALDATVLACAVGSRHPLRAPCRWP